MLRICAYLLSRALAALPRTCEFWLLLLLLSWQVLLLLLVCLLLSVLIFVAMCPDWSLRPVLMLVHSNLCSRFASHRAYVLLLDS
jgi:hypothetical protein